MPSSSKSPSSVSRFLRSDRFTTVLLVMFCIELIGLSVHTYLDIRERIKPENIVEQAEQEIRKNYPRIRSELTSEIKSQAPNIAETMSNQLIASSPQVRKWLQEVTRRQLRYGLDETTDFSSAQFKSFVQDNHNEIEDLLVKIEETPEQVEETILDLESKVEDRWGIQLQNQADNALALHRQFNDKLETINNGSSLTPKELLERRIARIVRTLAIERLPELPRPDLTQDVQALKDEN